MWLSTQFRRNLLLCNVGLHVYLSVIELWLQECTRILSVTYVNHCRQGARVSGDVYLDDILVFNDDPDHAWVETISVM